MIAGENQRSIEVGLEALEMADELRIDELRAHALDSIGLARARIGDPRGVADLEQSIAIAVAGNSLESVRGYANLGNALVEHGDLGRAFELYEQGRDAARRFGDADRILWFEVERMYEGYWRGTWDEMLRLADEIMPRSRADRPPRPSTMPGCCARASAWVVTNRRSPSRTPPARSSSADMPATRRCWCRPCRCRPGCWSRPGSQRRPPALAKELLSVWPQRCPTSYWVADLAFTLRELGTSALLDRAAAARPCGQPLAGSGRRGLGR